VSAENIGGADGGRTHDLRIANAKNLNGQVLDFETVAPTVSPLLKSDECAPVLKRARGRPPPDYGDMIPCPGCHGKPVYRAGALQPCKCGSKGNPRWPKTI
jgi:hypothetical protein